MKLQDVSRNSYCDMICTIGQYIKVNSCDVDFLQYRNNAS